MNRFASLFVSGLRLEWTPLLEVNPLLMLYLNDHSALLFVQRNYSVSQDMALVFGGSTGFGPKGSEFGGIETKPDSSIYLESASQIYARLAYYF